MTQTCAFIVRIIPAPPTPPPLEKPPNIFVSHPAAKMPRENSALSASPGAPSKRPAPPLLNIPSASRYRTCPDRPSKGSPQSRASGNPAGDDRSASHRLSPPAAPALPCTNCSSDKLPALLAASPAYPQTLHRASPQSHARFAPLPATQSLRAPNPARQSPLHGTRYAAHPAAPDQMPDEN